MHCGEVRYEVTAGIATITLVRPDRLNALTCEMEAALRAAVEQAGRDGSVRGIILTGEGQAFCGGSDVVELSSVVDASLPVEDFVGGGGLFDQPLSYFLATPKIVLAAVNGACAGLGFVIATYCDLRFAAEGAFFTTSFAARGLAAEHGVAWTLPRIVGSGAALDLLCSARRVGAAEALDMRLVSRVVPREALLAASRDYLL